MPMERQRACSACLRPDRIRDLNVALGRRVEEVVGVARVVRPDFAGVDLEDLLVRSGVDIACDRLDRDLV